ncbi:MAG: CRISPR system precrRNA processing endoribonuclease RAMP protein Cas6 [Blastocatellia bacterium]
MVVQPASKPADPSLATLRIGVLRFKLTPVSLLIVPAVNKGNMLRGGFGHSFRRLACIPECRDAHICPIAEQCPYKQVFEPSPPAGAARLSKNQDIPRPFVFRPPQSSKTHFERNEPFEFEMVLIGRALDYIPYFVLAFRELAEGGLGLNRGHCTLDRVEALGVDMGNRVSGADVEPPAASNAPSSLDKPLYSSEDQLFRSINGIDSTGWLESRLRRLRAENDDSHSTLKLIFSTPTLIRAQGQVIHEPEFHHLFKRLRDRINALSTFFGDGPLDIDFRGIGERAENVSRITWRFEWDPRERTSSKTSQRHEISGFVGEGTYEGELTEFLPWLAMGELVNVGKHTAWGNGRFVMV